MKNITLSDGYSVGPHHKDGKICLEADIESMECYHSVSIPISILLTKKDVEDMLELFEEED